MWFSNSRQHSVLNSIKYSLITLRGGAQAEIFVSVFFPGNMVHVLAIIFTSHMPFHFSFSIFYPFMCSYVIKMVNLFYSCINMNENIMQENDIYPGKILHPNGLYIRWKYSLLALVIQMDVICLCSYTM